jgi:trk system potassium uptake protein TrkA
MEFIVVGCGRVGGELANRLFQNGHTVIVIDQGSEAFLNLPINFKGRTVEGDSLNQHVLEQAGIDQVDGLAAVTSSDAVNAVVAHLARTVYNVPIVVVRNFDSHLRSVQEIFGLQVVSSSSWGAQRVEELLYQQETRTVFSAGNGEVEVYEFTIHSEWDGRQLKDLLPDRDCVAVALTRAGRAVLPSAQEIIKPGDVILVSATLEGSQVLRERLGTGTKPRIRKEA